eukprot:4439665-Pyramimonas_sp.AAC.2
MHDYQPPAELHKKPVKGMAALHNSHTHTYAALHNSHPRTMWRYITVTRVHMRRYITVTHTRPAPPVSGWLPGTGGGKGHAWRSWLPGPGCGHGHASFACARDPPPRPQVRQPALRRKPPGQGGPSDRASAPPSDGYRSPKHYLVIFGHLWSCLVMFGHVWSRWALRPRLRSAVRRSSVAKTDLVMFGH